ncbi:metallophosphoesterase family protein [Listeria grandensis]|uniref:metallophosphoesterase family protein n=1 Tax=Listeria grandensis TaxID=1494963 RepID=UPI00164CF4E0|nr:DNA repair exonuclease [Listeria grandensis]MBC6316822.1 DNA repair exonuclease [Listeria grandensis]
MKEVTFVHMADLHLDSPFLGLKHLPDAVFRQLKDSTFVSFTKAVDVAIREAVDFVIIAGDIYDEEDQSIKAQARFYREMERLNRKGIPVYLIHGNHDYVAKYQDRLQLPVNVTAFDTELEWHRFVSETGSVVNLYGFSYGERHIRETIYDRYRREGKADFHIGLLHGSEMTGNPTQDVYAPFRVNEMQEMDYWALGHIHLRQILTKKPMIYYPGNIQGRHRKETGEKGVTIVSLSETGAELKFVDTAAIIWEEKDVVVETEMDISALFQLLMQVVKESARADKAVLLSLVVRSEVALSGDVKQRMDSGEWLDMLQELWIDEPNFVWVMRVGYLEAKRDTDWLKSSGLLTEWELAKETLKQESEFYKATSSLFANGTMHRFLKDLDELERDALVDESADLLENMLEQFKGDLK